MKRKIFSIFLTLVLLLSFSLVTAVPAAVSANSTTFAGSAVSVESLHLCDQGAETEDAFNNEPETLVVDGVAFDAQTCSQVTIEGEVSILDLGAGWVDTAYIEIGLRPEATMGARNAGVYLIALNTATETQVHLQDYTGGGRTGNVINITKDADFRYKIRLETSGSIGGIANLEVWVGDASQGTATLPYGYASTWEETVAGALNEDYSNAHLFYSIIADRRGAADETYSATVGDITIDDTLYVGAGKQFTTIQAAIDFANSGDTVNVAAGTYPEDITIDKPLTIVSVPNTYPVIQGQSTGYQGAVNIAASNVVFGQDGAGFSVWGAGQAAVYFTQPVEGCLVEGNEIVAAPNMNALVTVGGQADHTIRYNTFTGNPASQLVYVNGTPSVSVLSEYVDFIYNYFEGTATGPALGQEAFNSTISGNTFNTITPYACLELWVGGNSVTGNDFNADLPPGAVYVLDNSGFGPGIPGGGNYDLDIDAVLANNYFLRAAVVDHPGSSLLPKIWAYIQDAVDAAVTGDTVDVIAGQYNENVALGKRLTLQGAGSGDNPASDTIITPPAGNGIDVCLPVGSPAVPTLVIQHLRVAGAPNDGIQVTDSSGDQNQGNWTLNDVACVGNGAGGGYGMGVDLNLNPAAYAEDVTVTDSVFNDNNYFGFKVNHGAGNVEITITGGEMNGNQSGLQALGHPGSTRVISIDGVTFEGNTVGVDLGADDDYGFNDGVVSLQNLTVVDNEIGMRFKGEGVGSSYGPGYLLPAGTITVLYCTITGHDTGVLIQDYSELDNMGLHYNNFCGNTMGLDNQCVDAVDATKNYWCDPSGPSHSPGYGNPISGDVIYDPWLLEPLVPGAPLPTTFDKTLALNIGWTLVSTDSWIDPAESVGVGVILAYNYTPSDGWFEVTPAALVPVDALYLKTEVGGALGIIYSGGYPAASSKDLKAGWNLISSATEGNARDILSPLRFIDMGEEQGVGLATLVSQGDYNQHTESFYLATLSQDDWNDLEDLNPFDGYWAYMNADKNFGVIPQ